MKVTLAGRVIPRKADGVTPNFTALNKHDHGDTPEGCILDVFSSDEVVELVNRALYQLEYQKVAHQKYQQRNRDWQKPVKLAAKLLFPQVSWLKLTTEQLKAAVEAAYPNNPSDQQTPQEEQ